MRNGTGSICGRAAGIAAVLILMTVLASLAGCAGGGGGGSNGPPSAYPPLATASTVHTGDGISATYSYSLDPDADQLILTTSDVSLAPNMPAAGEITITVSGIPVPGGPEPDFSMTVDPAALAILPNSPLGASTALSPQCADCLTTGTVTASDGQTVTFVYLNPDAVNLTYSAMGLWSKPTSLASPNDGTGVGGAFSIGVLTRGVDLPTTGTATYDGFFVGRYATSDTSTDPGIYAVGANAHGDVDFSGVGSVSFSTLNTHIAPEGPGGTLGVPVAESRLDLSTVSPMSITRTGTSNSFSGSDGTLTNGFGMHIGTISGAFYGMPTSDATPAPPEMGGTLAVGNDAGTQSMVGGFALTKN